MTCMHVCVCVSVSVCTHTHKLSLSLSLSLSQIMTDVTEGYWTERERLLHACEQFKSV